MTYALYSTLTAGKDLGHAADYIKFSLKTPQAADHLLGKAEEQIRSLSQFPPKIPARRG